MCGLKTQGARSQQTEDTNELSRRHELPRLEAACWCPVATLDHVIGEGESLELEAAQTFTHPCFTPHGGRSKRSLTPEPSGSHLDQKCTERKKSKHNRSKTAQDWISRWCDPVRPRCDPAWSLIDLHPGRLTRTLKTTSVGPLVEEPSHSDPGGRGRVSGSM